MPIYAYNKTERHCGEGILSVQDGHHAYKRIQRGSAKMRDTLSSMVYLMKCFQVYLHKKCLPKCDKEFTHFCPAFDFPQSRFHGMAGTCFKSHKILMASTLCITVSRMYGPSMPDMRIPLDGIY